MSMSRLFAGLIGVCIGSAALPASAQIVGGYFRGDLGWSGSVNADVHDKNFAVDHGIIGLNGAAGTSGDLGAAWVLGAGAGVEFSPRFRSEIVYTYRGDYHLDQIDGGDPPSLFKAKISSNSIMANAYLDFPFGRPGIAGFVGFGLGWSQVHLSDLSAVSTVVVNPPAGPNPTLVAPGGTRSNFGWQVMGGVAFALSEGIMMDVFYRYFDGGHLETDAGNVISDGAVVGTYSGAEGALHAHEVVVSLRFPIGF